MSKDTSQQNKVNSFNKQNVTVASRAAALLQKYSILAKYKNNSYLASYLF